MAHRDDIPLRPSTLQDASPLLAQAADMLASARSVAALREAVAFHRSLRRGIVRLLATDRTVGLGDAERRMLHDHAAYVVAVTDAPACPDDHHIEAFIVLARRDSQSLAAVVKQREDVPSAA